MHLALLAYLGWLSSKMPEGPEPATVIRGQQRPGGIRIPHTIIEAEPARKPKPKPDPRISRAEWH